MQDEYTSAPDIARFAAQFAPLLRRFEFSSATSSLGAAEARVLYCLGEHEGTAAQIASILGLDSGQMTRTTAQLERKGLIERRHPGKGRALLSLSDTGAILLEDLRAGHIDRTWEVWEAISSEERWAFKEAATSLAAGLDTMGQPVTIVEGALDDAGTLADQASWALLQTLEDPDEVKVAREMLQFMVKAISHRSLFALQGRQQLRGGLCYHHVGGKNEARISFLNVDIRFRNNGIGKALLAACADRARAEGAAQLTLALPEVPKASLTKFDPRWSKGKCTTRPFCGKRIDFRQWCLAL